MSSEDFFGMEAVKRAQRVGRNPKKNQTRATKDDWLFILGISSYPLYYERAFSLCVCVCLSVFFDFLILQDN